MAITVGVIALAALVELALGRVSATDLCQVLDKVYTPLVGLIGVLLGRRVGER